MDGGRKRDVQRGDDGKAESEGTGCGSNVTTKGRTQTYIPELGEHVDG